MSIANELITRGWTRYDREDEDGAVCIAGAAGYAACGNPHATFFQMTAHMVALRQALEQETALYVLIWNDLAETTYDDVLRIAKEADEILGAS